jgi:hypothetical protein
MRGRQIRIRYVYRNTETTIGDLLMESFHLFLKRILAEENAIRKT